MTSNRRIVLAERPVEMFTDSSFRVVESPVPEPGDGEAVVQVEYLSLDPTMRGWARDEPSYLPPVQLGEVMRGGAAGHVVASNNAAYRVGASVMGLLGWQEYAVVGGTTGMLANVLPDGIDLVDALSLYGSTGVTASRRSLSRRERLLALGSGLSGAPCRCARQSGYTHAAHWHLQFEGRQFHKGRSLLRRPQQRLGASPRIGTHRWELACYSCPKNA